MIKFMVFSSKKIANQPNLGERLKACRQKAGISLVQAALATSISSRYLAALEAGEHHKLPGEVYAKNFLKVYTKFLGLSCEEFLAYYNSEEKIYNKTRKVANNDFKKPVERISPVHLIVTPKVVRGVLIGILALTCLGYLGIKVKAIIKPPSLVVEAPADNLVTDQNFIEVIGQVEPEVNLEINGQQVLADQLGHFSETLDLQNGVNIIEIKAQTRHGRQTKVYRQVVVVGKEKEVN